MFIVDITLNMDLLSDEKREATLEEHRAWYKKYYEAGNFLIVGPFKNRGAAGVVIAKDMKREELEKIIAEDSFYPELATYEISEFTANLIVDNITEYRGQ